MLEEAHNKKERAKSQAELTRRGHVYIISNIGSFGENVFKLGMTRRLIPEDRVKELSDASVPFPFDIHGMIFSEDAPTLESKMHQIFHERRVNAVNLKKEFFNVSIDEVQSACEELGVRVDLLAVPEASEYRQTSAETTNGLITNNKVA